MRLIYKLPWYMRYFVLGFSALFIGIGGIVGLTWLRETHPVVLAIIVAIPVAILGCVLLGGFLNHMFFLGLDKDKR